MKVSDLQRFLDKVEKRGECWDWTGGITSKGYGTFQLQGRTVGAHRVSFTWFKGDIPRGKQIDHLCRNRKCVRAAHLEAVTPRENTLRGNGPTAINARRTHCTKGHKLSSSNVWRRESDNSRNCIRCKTLRRRQGVVKRRTV